MFNGKRTFGGLSIYIYASELMAFDNEEVLLLEELANECPVSAWNLEKLKYRD